MAAENHIDRVLGKVIRDLRVERELSQEKLAELGDFERSYISKVENGIRAIQFRTVIRFAEAFDIQPSELVRKFEVALENDK